jgi:ABC-type Fe3+-hydroxamate transport system substrate-binding protein
MPRPSPRLTLLAVLALAGCRRLASEEFPRVVSPGGFPVRIAGGASRPQEIPAPPRRILPANAAFVDFVRPLIEPERVVALPAAAKDFAPSIAGQPAWLARPRFHGFDLELVLSFAPDLVLAHPWQSAETLAGVRRSGVPVLVLPLPTSWEEVLATLELVSAVCGTEERGRTFRGELEARRAALCVSPVARRGWSALCYSNLGAGGSTAGRGTTADILFGLAGLRNAAREAGIEGHADLDVEGLVALDPDVIVVAAGQDGAPPPELGFLHSQPALETLGALREGRVIELPAGLFSSASFELLTAAERLTQALAACAQAPLSPPSSGATRGSPPGGS